MPHVTTELADEIKQAIEAMLRAHATELDVHVTLLRLRLFEAIEVLAGYDEIRMTVLACQLRRERERLESW